MGSSLPKPEFETVLPDQNVKTGDEITLQCNVKTDNVKIKWEKNGQILRPVEGKHIISKAVKKCTLKIKNAQPTDEGNYTLTIENTSGSDSCSAFVRVETKQWREINWNQNEMLIKLKEFKICEKVPELRFLMIGPVGAGKSSSINTIKSVFTKRQFVNCLAAAASEKSHTLTFERFGITEEDKPLPYAFHDIMGLQEEGGVCTDNIIKAIKGHITEGKNLDATYGSSEDNDNYKENPSLRDQIHCLIYIISADKVTIMSKELLRKTKAIRKVASKMGIPQVVFLTRIDCICPITRDDLQKVYISKKIRDQIQECSNLVGVPANCIFPVKNYSDETHIKDEINCLIMDALIQVLNWANDYVKISKMPE